MDGWLTFASAQEWADWLEVHHGTAEQAWLALPKKGTAASSLTRREAWEVALCFGWIDGQAASAALPDGWWGQRFTPRRSRSRWSKVNCTAVQRLTAAGRMRPAGLEQVRRAKQDGRWDAAYDPPSKATVPEDLREALERSPGASAAFAALDARRRYHFLNAIQQAKRPTTRARRIALVLAALPPAE